MTQQIKIAEYLNYLYTCKRISSANIIAFLVDMFHKAKYGEFLFSDVNYNLNEIKRFQMTKPDQLSDLMTSSDTAEEIYALVDAHCNIKNKFWQIEVFLVENKDKLYTQYDVYRIFVQYIKDYILFDILPYGKRSL